MTKKELEKQLLDLQNDFKRLTIIVNEVFTQRGILKQNDCYNRDLMELIHKHIKD